MRTYVDCVLALLPFEPEAYRRLDGPRCVYVGHPLIERLGDLRPNAGEAGRPASAPPLIVVLPGSRRSEVSRLMADFGGALAALRQSIGPFSLVLPTLPHIEREVRALAARWPEPPTIALGEQAKYAAFRVGPRGARRLRHRDARIGARRRARWSGPTRSRASRSSSNT